jgi:hypothetical protein
MNIIVFNLCENYFYTITISIRKKHKLEIEMDINNLK